MPKAIHRKRHPLGSKFIRLLFGLPSAFLIALTAANIVHASQLTSQSPSQPLAEAVSEKQDKFPKPVPQSVVDSDSVVRAIYNLLVMPSHSFELDLSILASTSGFSFSSNAQIQSIVGPSGKFQSVIELAEANVSESSQYVVTSDGQQVWILDLSLNAYSVMTYQAFLDDYRDGFLTGFLTNFILGFTQDIDIDTQALASIPAEELFQDEVFLDRFKAALGLDSSNVGTEIVNGKQYTTLTYAESQDEPMTLFIDPMTSLIEKIHISGPFRGGEIIIQENATHTVSPDPIPQGTFTFSPPTGAQLSDTPISISPF